VVVRDGVHVGKVSVNELFEAGGRHAEVTLVSFGGDALIAVFADLRRACRYVISPPGILLRNEDDHPWTC
jgi:class 3 adenylate cyclase